MKIALVGTSCVGKTTLCVELQTHLDNAIVIPEASRQYFQEHPFVERFGLSTQADIQVAAYLKEVESAFHCPTATQICDRSVLDAPAYVLATGNSSGARYLMDRVGFWIPSYDKIYLLNPRDVAYRTDDVRKESDYDRRRFHEGFLDLFALYRISYVLLSGTSAARVKRVLEDIR